MKERIKKWKRMFIPDEQMQRVKPWFEAEGDLTYRLDYDTLDSSSIIVDLGGYKGQWASDIFARYQLSVFVFEPVYSYFNFIINRFKKNSKITIKQFALGDKNSSAEIFLNADGSSIIRKLGQAETIQFKKFDEMMLELGIEKIDLLKINIEGGEYELLDYLLEIGWAKKITNIQVQFHDFFPNAEVRMKKIQDGLKESHSLTYQYKFVWENWKLNS